MLWRCLGWEVVAGSFFVTCLAGCLRVEGVQEVRVCLHLQWLSLWLVWKTLPFVFLQPLVGWNWAFFAYVLATTTISSLWLASSNLKSVVSSYLSSILNSVLSSSLSSVMSSLSTFPFIFCLLGAFWMASMVLTNVEFISQKPYCFCCSSVGGRVPSRLLGWGENVTWELWYLWGFFTNW